MSKNVIHLCVLKGLEVFVPHQSRSQASRQIRKKLKQVCKISIICP